MTNIFDRSVRLISATKIQTVIAIILISCGGIGQVYALPHITTQPTNQSVSLGANVTELVFASGIAPLAYQWHFNDAEIAGATKRTLILTNVQVASAGGYSVVVTDTSGSVTSVVARLEVDQTFRIINTGPIPTDGGTSVSAAWGDYDNDGFLDLMLGNITGQGFLYRNKGDGTFKRLHTNVIGGLSLGSGPWIDYDNDGLLDMYTVSAQDLGVHLYRNQGNGTLLLLTNAAVIGPIVTNHTFSGSVAWADYDNDGFVDAFVANGTFGGDKKSFLYHNQKNGTFIKVTAGSIVNDLYESWTGAWADYDDDGLLDLFVTSNGGFTPSGLGEDNRLYHNDGPSGFTKLTTAQTGIPLHDGGFSRGCAWGDYDNDGRLDLFVAGHTNLLYHNIGGGRFEKVTTGRIVTDTSINESIGCTWVDYDNDGYLDLLVINVSDVNFLYHNNGDGTFTRLNSGSLVNDGPTLSHIDAAWADYDNDGFMDVVIVADSGNNSLYHNNGINNGNTNHWFSLKLVGTASNRQAIGAKVRIKATIGGKTFWQRRDIGASTSQLGQSDLRAGFGLGDATNIDIVRIEWPSGTVQEMHNVATKQFLTVTEPPRLKGSVIGGEYQLALNGGVGFTYDVQTSTNLIDWTFLTNLVSTNMTMPVMSQDIAQVPQQYYRVGPAGRQAWETVANMPTARDSLGAAAGPDGRIYAIGGEDASGSGGLDTVEAYTPGTPGSWATMARMPTPRSFHAVVAGKDGRIYAMGGLAPIGGVLATLEVYTPSTDSWATKASMPTARAWFSAAAGPDGRIYAIGGGNDSDNVLTTVEVYTPNSDSWATATSMPTARSDFAAATTADRLTTYVIGGYSPAGYGLNTVEAFTPNAGAGTWATKAGMPTARGLLGAAAGADGRIYAIGGNNVVFNVAAAEAYTPGTDSWVTVPRMPTKRALLAVVTGADGRIYAIGGQDGPNAVGAKVEVYTP